MNMRSRFQTLVLLGGAAAVGLLGMGTSKAHAQYVGNPGCYDGYSYGGPVAVAPAYVPAVAPYYVAPAYPYANGYAGGVYGTPFVFSRGGFYGGHGWGHGGHYYGGHGYGRHGGHH